MASSTHQSWFGALAQLGEHLLCKQGVGGSIPPGSTILASIADRIGQPWASGLSRPIRTTDSVKKEKHQNRWFARVWA